MLIINDIDIIQTDATKIEYRSTDVETKQSSNGGTMALATNTVPSTKKKLVPSGHSFRSNQHRNPIATQTTTTITIEDETPISISQINPYDNK